MEEAISQYFFLRKRCKLELLTVANTLNNEGDRTVCLLKEA